MDQAIGEKKMNENEFECNGKVYVDEKAISSCVGCAFNSNNKLCLCAPLCTKAHRKDGRNVIFVEKQP